MLIVALAVFLGCSLGATAGTLLVFPVSGAAILFIPYAVLTAALLLSPVRLWWAFVLASALGNFGSHVAHEETFSFVALAEGANIARALVVAGGLRVLGNPSNRLGTLKGMATFLVFAGLLGPAVGAFIGAADKVLHETDADYWLVWQSWMSSNALAGLTLLPAILLFAREGVTWLRPRSLTRLIEGSLFAVCLAGVGFYVFSADRGGGELPTYLYVTLPLLIWSALRFGSKGGIAALSAVTAFAIAGVSAGRGPFVAQPSTDSVLNLQLFLLDMSIPVLLLAAVLEQLTEAARELRHGQSLYRSVVEDQTELICRYLPDGTCTFMNGAYCRHLGRSENELVGGSMWTLIPEERREVLANITSENPVATREHQVESGGEVRWHQWTERGLFDDAGRLVEFQAVGRDVTDRKRAEEEHRLLESKRRDEQLLRETDRRKDEFLAVLAHELRNPLAPISLAVETMKTEPLPEESANARDMIGRQVVHITRLVDDLLDISRITQGKIKLNLDNVDLVRVAVQAVEAFRPVMEARRHELAVSLPGLPLHTRADSARLAQIVSNLLDNAAKYTEPGGRIYLVVAQDGGDALLTVGDNGVGIAPDHLRNIFDAFTQVPGALSDAHGGLGIGLTLVKRLVEMHGGRIYARSAGLGQGSEFVVRLPALAAPARHETSTARPTGLEQVPLRILVVDDNVDAAASLARLLRIWGHRVEIAYDGPAALAAEAAFGPNVMLLDLALPIIDGIEVARRVRQRTSSESLLLVALTGFGQPADRRRTATAGFDHHFTKPLDVGTLQTLLASWGHANGSAVQVSQA